MTIECGLSRAYVRSLDEYGWKPVSFTYSVLKTLMSNKVEQEVAREA